MDVAHQLLVLLHLVASPRCSAVCSCSSAAASPRSTRRCCTGRWSRWSSGVALWVLADSFDVRRRRLAPWWSRPWSAAFVTLLVVAQPPVPLDPARAAAPDHAARARRSRDRGVLVSVRPGAAARGWPSCCLRRRPRGAPVRLSARVDYALRAMAELAAADAPRTVDQLSAAQHIPQQVPGEHPRRAAPRRAAAQPARPRRRLPAGPPGRRDQHRRRHPRPRRRARQRPRQPPGAPGVRRRGRAPAGGLDRAAGLRAGDPRGRQPRPRRRQRDARARRRPGRQPRRLELSLRPRGSVPRRCPT